MDPQMLAKLVSEAKPLDQQLAATPDRYLRVDVTTQLDISDLMALQTQALPIERVRSASPLGGTVVVRRSWFARVWHGLTRRAPVGVVGLV
jgi:hypothetical protein